MQTLEQVLRQYALNPLVQTKIELFEGRKPEVSPLDAKQSQQIACDINEKQVGFLQRRKEKLSCIICDKELLLTEAFRSVAGYQIVELLCGDCYNIQEQLKTAEAAAVRSTADSSLANNTMAHTPAIIGKLNISNPA